VRLTAFNQRTTPEVSGTVIRVAADLTKEQQGPKRSRQGTLSFIRCACVSRIGSSHRHHSHDRLRVADL
jgi:hypothetical protein